MMTRFTNIYIMIMKLQWVNSLAPGRFQRNLRKLIFKLILMIGSWGIFCKIALRWMSMDLTHDKSTLVQVMAWCRQATSHYLSQCWPRSLSPYGVTRPQWVKVCNLYMFIKVKQLWLFNTLRPRQNGCHFTEDICKCIFLNENAWISLKMLLKFVPKVPINNIPALI